jgi:hypothetical protein
MATLIFYNKIGIDIEMLAYIIITIPKWAFSYTLNA